MEEKTYSPSASSLWDVAAGQAFAGMAWALYLAPLPTTQSVDQFSYSLKNFSPSHGLLFLPLSSPPLALLSSQVSVHLFFSPFCSLHFVLCDVYMVVEVWLSLPAYLLSMASSSHHHHHNEYIFVMVAGRRARRALNSMATLYIAARNAFAYVIDNMAWRNNKPDSHVTIREKKSEKQNRQNIVLNGIWHRSKTDAHMLCIFSSRKEEGRKHHEKGPQQWRVNMAAALMA